MLALQKYFLLLCLPLFLWAGNGSRAGGFNRIGLGASGQALGNTGAAYLEAMPASIYYNPALLNSIEQRGFELGYNAMSLDREFMYAAFAMRLRGKASIGVNYLRGGVGNIVGRDVTGEIFGNIDNSFHAIQVAFARSFGPVSVGFGLKLMFEYIDFDRYNYSGQGVGIDLGVLYRISDDLQIGAQVKDINSRLESNTDNIYQEGGINQNLFPIIYRFGVGWRVDPDYGAAYYDVEVSSQNTIKHHLGIESAAFYDMFRLRGGLENERFSGGFQVILELWEHQTHVNYVYLPSVVDEGDSHGFTWVFHF